MPIGILKFKLPEEKEEFEIASHAQHYYSLIEETQYFIAQELKHAELTDDERVRLERIASALRI